MHPKDADGMANSVDPDQTASSEAVWSWSALFDETYLSQYIEFVQYICVARGVHRWLGILHPFQQYFSNIRMIGGWLWKAVCNGTQFTVDKISASKKNQTWDC